MNIKTSISACVFVAVSIGLVPGQRASADIVADFSPDTTGAPISLIFGNSSLHQQIGDKFTLPVATTIDGASIFSLRNSRGGHVGFPVRLVILPDEGGVPGTVPLIDVDTLLDEVDELLATSLFRHNRKHASIPPQTLPAGTYWFFMKGTFGFDIGGAMGHYDDNLVFLGYPPPVLDIPFAGHGDVFFAIHGTPDDDSDGDGVPDDEDCQPDSDLSMTVVIGDCDSGVVNLLFDDGCTISDLIAECADDAGNHGQFVSCVAHLTNDLKKDGFISGREKGAIQRCAAQADIP
jgi:hypothetical protein